MKLQTEPQAASPSTCYKQQETPGTMPTGAISHLHRRFLCRCLKHIHLQGRRHPCSKRLLFACPKFNTTTLCQKLKRIISSQKLKPDAIFFPRRLCQLFSSPLETAFKTSHRSAERASAQWAEQAGHLPSLKDCQMTTLHLSPCSQKPGECPQASCLPRAATATPAHLTIP